MPEEREIDLELTQIAHGGEAIGRLQGKPVFVPGGIPGETVRARLAEERRNYARAELVRVLTPSPDRVEPPCPHAPVSPDCRWQHIAYRRQLELCLEVVADQMRRLGHIAEPPIEGIVPAPEAWHYRNHLFFEPPVGGGEEATGLAYPAVDGSGLVPLECCPVAHELVEELALSLDFAWAGLSGLHLRAGITTGEQLILLETDREGVPEIAVDMPVSIAHRDGSGRLYTLVGDAFVRESIGGRMLRLSAPSPFPGNTAQVENLVEVVRQFCALEGRERVLDLYAGVGLFSLDLAGRAAEVVAVEESPWAASDAEENGAGVANLTVLEGEAVEVVPRLEGAFEVVVVSPPRTGCGAALIGQVAAIEPRRLVYVAEDPATLARDTGPLLSAGFRLESILALDLYPQTPRVDCVALFARP